MCACVRDRGRNMTYSRILILLVALIPTLNGNPITSRVHGGLTVGHNIHKRNLFGSNSSLAFLPDLLSLLASSGSPGDSGSVPASPATGIATLIGPITTAIFTGVKTALFNSTLPATGIIGTKTAPVPSVAGAAFSGALFPAPPALYKIRPIVYGRAVSATVSGHRSPQPDIQQLDRATTVQDNDNDNLQSTIIQLRSGTISPTLPLPAERTVGNTNNRKKRSTETESHKEIGDRRYFNAPLGTDHMSIPRRSDTNRTKRSNVSIDTNYSKVRRAGSHVTKRQTDTSSTGLSVLSNFFSLLLSRPEQYQLRPIVFNVPSENQMSTINIVQSLSNILGNNTDTISALTTFNVSSDTTEEGEVSKSTKHRGFVTESHTAGRNNGIIFTNHSQQAAHETHQHVEYNTDAENDVNTRRRRELVGASPEPGLPSGFDLPTVEVTTITTQMPNLQIGGGFNLPAFDATSNTPSLVANLNLGTGLTFDNTNLFNSPVLTTSSFTLDGNVNNPTQILNANNAVSSENRTSFTSPVNTASVQTTFGSNGNKASITENQSGVGGVSFDQFGNSANTAPTSLTESLNFGNGISLGNTNQLLTPSIFQETSTVQSTVVNSVLPASNTDSTTHFQNIFEQAFPNREHSGEIYQNSKFEQNNANTGSETFSSLSETDQRNEFTNIFEQAFPVKESSNEIYQDESTVEKNNNFGENTEISSAVNNLGLNTRKLFINIFEQMIPAREHSNEIYQENSASVSNSLNTQVSPPSINPNNNSTDNIFEQAIPIKEQSNTIYDNDAQGQMGTNDKTSLTINNQDNDNSFVNIFEQMTPSREHSNENYQTKDENELTRFDINISITSRKNDNEDSFVNILEQMIPNREATNEIYQEHIENGAPQSRPQTQALNTPTDVENISFNTILEQMIPNKEPSNEIYQEQATSDATRSSIQTSSTSDSDDFIFRNIIEQAIPTREASNEIYQQQDGGDQRINTQISSTFNNAELNSTSRDNIFAQKIPNREHSGEIYQLDEQQNLGLEFSIGTETTTPRNIFDISFDNILEQKIPAREPTGEIYQDAVAVSNVFGDVLPQENTRDDRPSTPAVVNQEVRTGFNRGGASTGTSSDLTVFASAGQLAQNASRDGFLYVVPDLKDPVDFESKGVVAQFRASAALSPVSLLATPDDEHGTTKTVPQFDQLPLEPGFFDNGPFVVRNSYGEAVFRVRR